MRLFKRKPKQEKVWLKDGVMLCTGISLKLARRNGKRIMGNLYLALKVKEFKEIIND